MQENKLVLNRMKNQLRKYSDRFKNIYSVDKENFKFQGGMIK